MNTKMSDKMDITLDDVETAIKVLNIFMKRQKQALSIMTKIGATTRGRGGASFRMEDVMGMIMQEKMVQKGVTPEATVAPIEELTDEELKRMRDIKEKLKKEGSSSSNHRGY